MIKNKFLCSLEWPLGNNPSPIFPLIFFLGFVLCLMGILTSLLLCNLHFLQCSPLVSIDPLPISFLFIKMNLSDVSRQLPFYSYIIILLWPSIMYLKQTAELLFSLDYIHSAFQRFPHPPKLLCASAIIPIHCSIAYITSPTLNSYFQVHLQQSRCPQFVHKGYTFYS